MTEKTEDKKGRKTFNLTSGDDPDRIGFAVAKGGRAKKFKPIMPAEVDVVIVLRATNSTNSRRPYLNQD